MSPIPSTAAESSADSQKILRTSYTQAEIDKVMNYTLMTDALFCRAFDEPMAEYILSIVLGKKLKVTRAIQQLTIPELFGRGSRFDVFATDEDGIEYNIEVQNANGGAHEKRARFNAGCMDNRIITKSMKYKDFPEVFIVYITEQDYLGYGLPLYTIDRYINENGKPFKDGQHIVYVNGTYDKDNTPLAQLMRDMKQKDYRKIQNPHLAEQVRLCKKGQVLNEMCIELEESFAAGEAKGRAEGHAEGAIESTLQSIRNFMKNTGAPLETAFEVLGCSDDIRKSICERIAKV